MTTATISARSRNLSLGWTTSVIDGDRGWRIATPGAPIERGGPSTVRRQRRELRSVTSGGTYYNAALFVGDRRVIRWRIEGYDGWRDAKDDDGQLLELITHGFDDGWGMEYTRRVRVEVELA